MIISYLPQTSAPYAIAVGSYDNICKYFEHSGDKITASIPHEKLDFIVHPSEGLDFQDEPTYDYGRLMDTIMDRMLERNLVQDDELVVSC